MVIPSQIAPDDLALSQTPRHSTSPCPARLYRLSDTLLAIGLRLSAALSAAVTSLRWTSRVVSYAHNWGLGCVRRAVTLRCSAIQADVRGRAVAVSGLYQTLASALRVSSTNPVSGGTEGLASVVACSPCPNMLAPTFRGPVMASVCTMAIYSTRKFPPT